MTNICDQRCSDCMARTPCAFSAVRIPSAECNKHFRNQACFANHKQSTSNNKFICERKRSCATCGEMKRSNKHDCSKRYCDTCKQNGDVRHLCYKRSLKDVLPANADKVLYLFYDFETSQNIRFSDMAKSHVPKLVCFKSIVLGVRKAT